MNLIQNSFFSETIEDRKRHLVCTKIEFAKKFVESYMIENYTNAITLATIAQIFLANIKYKEYKII